jgi:hypothetical protein
MTSFISREELRCALELHVHPYAETFLLLESRGRWTRGEDLLELAPQDVLVVPPDTPRGFRNGGGLRDAGWDGSARPTARLAILPATTHYEICAAPGLVPAVVPFLDAAPA